MSGRIDIKQAKRIRQADPIEQVSEQIWEPKIPWLDEINEKHRQKVEQAKKDKQPTQAKAKKVIKKEKMKKIKKGR